MLKITQLFHCYYACFQYDPGKPAEQNIVTACCHTIQQGFILRPCHQQYHRFVFPGSILLNVLYKHTTVHIKQQGFHENQIYIILIVQRNRLLSTSRQQYLKAHAYKLSFKPALALLKSGAIVGAVAVSLPIASYIFLQIPVNWLHQMRTAFGLMAYFFSFGILMIAAVLSLISGVWMALIWLSKSSARRVHD